MIHISFNTPGEWGVFSMTASWRDADGFAHTDSYTPEDVAAAGYAEAMQGVVSALVGLAEPWQARQVWVRLGFDVIPSAAEGEPDTVCEYVRLRVEAEHPQGGSRAFDSNDYPAFKVTTPAAVEAYKYFTRNNTL